MHRIDNEELKKIQVDILQYVHEFCIENDIKYWLNFGTLLGAVRHKWYIPWDDDIDIGMLRSDYEKFIRLFNSSCERYRFLCIENSDDYPYAYGKVVDQNTVLYEPDKTGVKTAVYIDVFVHDNAPENARTIKKMYRRRDVYNYLNLARIHKSSTRSSYIRRLLFKCIRLIVLVCPYNYFARKISEGAQIYRDMDTEMIGNFCGYYTFTCPKKWVEDLMDCKFEERTYKIPARYDEWLRCSYGDYMTLPPEEKRKTHHLFEAYYLK